MKRILALFLLLALLLPMIPATPAQAAELDNSIRPEVRKQVAKVINSYGDQLYDSTAAVDAIMAMGLHALFKNGAFLNVNEGDALVSSLFNANLFRDATIEGLTDSILTMQRLRLTEMLVAGGPHWHVYNDSFNYIGYAGTEKDYNYRLNTISSCGEVYGTNTWPGSMNRNDYAMQLLIGWLSSNTIIRQTETKNGTAVYTIRMVIGDNFDFDSNYSSAENKGWDPSIDRALVKLGRLLDMFVIDTFDWEFVKEFQVEVPFPCDHLLGGYSWELDPETKDLNSVTEGFLVNKATTKTTTNSKTGALQYHYRLEKPITLNHDQPWVVEYESQKLSSLSFLAASTNTFLPMFRQYSRNYFWVQEIEYIPYAWDSNNNVSKFTAAYHYYAAKIPSDYKYSSKHTYTARIENVPGSSGNMVYASIYDNDLGQMVMEPTPLNDYLYKKSGAAKQALVSEEDNRLNGKDIVINYIGNKNYPITTNTLSLRIWESGENVTSSENVTTEYKAPTCTEDGGTYHACRECGYGYVTNVQKALGHDYGTYTSDGNAGCEQDGTKTASCSRCGYKNTVTDSGTATGHNVIQQIAVDATCDTPGVTAGSYCDRCYTVYQEQQVIPAPGHSWQEADCNTPKTCSVCKLTEGEAAGHEPVTLPAKAATCTETGLTEGSACGRCGEILTAQEEIPLDEEGHGWQEATCTAPATCAYCGEIQGEVLGHQEEVVRAAEATCLESGLTEGKICTRCGTVTKEQEAVPPVGHSWQEATCEAPMTCVRCGATEGDVHAHKEIPLPAVDPTCEDTGLTEGSVCSDCGTVTVPQAPVSALGHSWLDATCEAPKTCERCEATEGEPLGHALAVLPGSAPTCTENGITEGASCTACEEILTEQEQIPALGHSWQAATCDTPETCTVCSATQGDVSPHQSVTDSGKAATCTNAGLSDGAHCGACGTVLTEQKEIPPIGHDWQEATCTSPERCANCGATNGAAKGHDPVTDPKADATCTETGLTEGSHCADCGTILTEQTEIDALGHKWTAASCTKAKTCSRCDITEGDVKGHTPEKGEKKDPTCTAAGHNGITRCKDCSAVLDSGETVPATGHKDANSDGKCDACGAKLTSNQAPETSTQPTTEATEATETPEPTENKLILSAPPAQKEDSASTETQAPVVTTGPLQETGAQEQNSGSGNIFLVIALVALAGIGCCLVLLKKLKK